MSGVWVDVTGMCAIFCCTSGRRAAVFVVNLSLMDVRGWHFRIGNGDWMLEDSIACVTLCGLGSVQIVEHCTRKA